MSEFHKTAPAWSFEDRGMASALTTIPNVGPAVARHLERLDITELLTIVRDAGFADARHVASRDLAERYFAGRSDGLRPSSGEDLVVAMT